ncbi:MAG: DegT/DnrJ/EryC1/StrS family aminotransferase [Planctomycetota bacterium]|nr:DegT/DnrJ/EryC1/StrS family aminotransferase [Planctomycetota bacterium]
MTPVEDRPLIPEVAPAGAKGVVHPWRIALSSPDIDHHDRAAVDAVLRSGRLAGGPAIGQLEQLASDTFRRPTVSCSSGTAGLILALRALGVSGGEVITPALGFIATAHAIRAVGATPRFCDVDRETLCVGLEQLEAAWSDDVSAVIPVDLLGVQVPIDAIVEWAKQRAVPVIEDACEALGSRHGDSPCGSAADAAVFGFYPNKIITMGEGGLVSCRDQALADRVRQLANQGRTGAGFCFEGEGYNFRLTEMQAALGASQWLRLDALIERRQQLAQLYLERIEAIPGVIPAPAPTRIDEGDRRSWFAFVVLLEDSRWRTPLRDAMAQHGIETGLYFPSIATFTPYDEAPAAALPVTDQISPRMLALPLHPRLKPAQIDEVVATLEESLGRIRLEA